MSVIHDFIEAARQDRPVYICDVRDAFQREGARPFHIHLALYDGSVRRFALRLPRAEDGEERAFIEEYLNATIYNALSALGARMVSIYVDPADAELLNYASALKDTFQVDLPLRARSGYGYCCSSIGKYQRGLDISATRQRPGKTCVERVARRSGVHGSHLESGCAHIAGISQCIRAISTGLGNNVFHAACPQIFHALFHTGLLGQVGSHDAQLGDEISDRRVEMI